MEILPDVAADELKYLEFQVPRMMRTTIGAFDFLLGGLLRHRSMARTASDRLISEGFETFLLVTLVRPPYR
jgi:hypothetical protein